MRRKPLSSNIFAYCIFRRGFLTQKYFFTRGRRSVKYCQATHWPEIIQTSLPCAIEHQPSAIRVFVSQPDGGDWLCGAAPRFRRGPVKYRFRTLYELDSLAVVNVRDAGNCKNAFKLLMFPDTKMFQAENPKAKVSPSPLVSSSLSSPLLSSLLAGGFTWRLSYVDV